MPIYLYTCAEGHLAEQIHSITEDPKVTCSECSNNMTRIPQATAVKFMGSGWASKEK